MTFLSRSLMMTALATLAALTNAALGEAQTLRFQLQPLWQHDHLGAACRLPQRISSASLDMTTIAERTRARQSMARRVINPDGSLSIGYTTSLSYSV